MSDQFIETLGDLKWNGMGSVCAPHSAECRGMSRLDLDALIARLRGPGLIGSWPLTSTALGGFGSGVCKRDGICSGGAEAHLPLFVIPPEDEEPFA